MEKETRQYRNYVKTEEAIKKSLIKLYKQKRNINKITVKELCEVANISRSTFYLHYNDLISIFESVGDRFIISLKEMINELSLTETLDFKPYLETILNLINESSELMKIGLTSEYRLVYIDTFKEELESFIINTPVINTIKFEGEQTLTEVRIVVAGMIDFIITLIKNNDQIDVIKYSTILNDFIVKLTKSFIK